MTDTQASEREELAERVARAFHGAYEELAPEHGYDTREASRRLWAEVPEQNRALMIGTVKRLLATGVIADAALLTQLLEAIEEWESYAQRNGTGSGDERLIETAAELRAKLSDTKEAG